MTHMPTKEEMKAKKGILIHCDRDYIECLDCGWRKDYDRINGVPDNLKIQDAVDHTCEKEAKQ